MSDDLSAIERVLSGDREAFWELVVRHQSAVCATIRALGSTHDDYEDVAQETFLAAFRHLGSFDPNRGSFRVWLLAIARNCCRTPPKGPVQGECELIEHPVDERTPERLATQAECFERLDAALAALPDEQRLVFVLVELQGLSYREAAEVSGTTVGTVKSRLSRAKEWLRESLGRWSRHRAVCRPGRNLELTTGGRAMHDEPIYGNWRQARSHVEPDDGFADRVMREVRAASPVTGPVPGGTSSAGEVGRLAGARRWARVGVCAAAGLAALFRVVELLSMFSSIRVGE